MAKSSIWGSKITGKIIQHSLYLVPNFYQMMLSRKILKLAVRKEKLSYGLGHARVAFREAGVKWNKVVCLLKSCHNKCVCRARDKHTEIYSGKKTKRELPPKGERRRKRKWNSLCSI